MPDPLGGFERVGRPRDAHADRETSGRARLLSRPLDVWNAFWFRDVSGLPFALVRILFALSAVVTLIELAPLLAEHYTADGYFPIASAQQWSWGNLIGFLHVSALDGLPQVTAIFTILLFCVVLLGLGWHTRSTSALTFLLLLWFQTRNPTFLNGGDEVLRLTAFYLFLGYLVVPPEERTLSVDRNRALNRMSRGPHAGHPLLGGADAHVARADDPNPDLYPVLRRGLVEAVG